MHINSMPDLVLRLIFHKIPLRYLFWIGRVCELWKWHQMEIIKRVRSLTLVIGPTDTQSLITKSCFTHKYRDLLLNEDGRRMYSSQYLHKRLHLTFVTLSAEYALELSNIFPYITTLEIAIKDVPVQMVFSPMVTLLTKWSPKLKSLKIYLDIQIYRHDYLTRPSISHKEANELVNLLNIINSMKSLEHLTFETNISIRKFLDFLELTIKSPSLNCIDLPILGQLREFYFYSNDDIDIMENSLQSYAAQNDNLKQIGLQYVTFDAIYRRFPQLTSKTAQLSRSAIENPSRMLEYLKTFSSLNYLYLENSFNASCTAIFKGALNSASQLSHLHLNLSYFQHFLNETQLSSDRLRQLVSVQVLTIDTSYTSYMRPDLNFESNHWAFLFPNVQVIEFIMDRYEDWENSTLQASLSTFVQCPKLHHLFTYVGTFSDVYGSVTEWIIVKKRDQKFIKELIKTD